VIKWNISEEYKKSKVFFNEWWKNTPHQDIILKDVERLKIDFENFIKSKDYGGQEAQGIPGNVQT
jgi:hypothetical protein